MDDMETSLNCRDDESIAQALRMLSTHIDGATRQSYGRCVLRSLHKPIDLILNDICTIVSTLLVVSEDKEATVRSSLLAEIPDIVIKCCELANEDVDRYICDRSLDIMLQYLEDVEPQLRKNAFYAVKHLLEKSVLDEHRVLVKICPAIVGLSNLPFKNHDVDYYTNAIELQTTILEVATQLVSCELTVCRCNIAQCLRTKSNRLSSQSGCEMLYLHFHITASFDELKRSRIINNLMALLATIIGPINTEKCLLDRFCEMCEDEVYSIRRWCADYMPVFCHVLGQTITEERLLPIFKLLCEDSVWGVRKSAAKSLPKVALICSLQRRREILAPIAFNLLNDSSRFVSGSAFKNLGQFIATFAQPCVIELEYGSSGKFYITSKSNDVKSQSANSWTETEENPLPTYRCDDSYLTLQAMEQNPFRKFLKGEPFSSIQSITPIDLMNMNRQSLQRVNERSLVESTENSLMDEQSQIMIPPMSNENLNEDDDTPSSSGCSSSSSTDGGDDNANGEDVMKIDIVQKDNLTETNDCDSASGKGDLKDNITKEEEEYTDDFYDSFPNDILNQLPDGLREVIAQIRESTHADIRQRHKESRLRMLRDKEHNRNMKKAELRAKLLGIKPPILANGPVDPPPPNPTQHPCLDNINRLSKPLFPWKLKAKVNNKKSTDSQSADVPQSDSNSLVIDNTKVTLRKKGTSQINADDEEEISQPIQSSSSNDDEFNSHQFWYISPPTIDIDNELKSLRELQDAQTNERSYDAESTFVPFEINSSELLRHYRDDRNEMLINNRTFGRLFDMFEAPPANDANDNIHKQKLDKLKANCVGPGQDPKFSYFNQSIVPPYLIEYFASMEQFADSDFNMYCVYNFPAVVLTLKKENWYLMYDLLLFLAADIQWKVRKTIAMFICDIAVIIGRENTHRDLMPIFLGFFKDLDEVKIEALKNLPMFLSVIDVEEHPKVIANLGECLQCDNDSNWRFREELARQLLHLIKTYGHVYHVDYMIYVTGMAIMLLTDKVSAVRTVAMDAMAEKFCNSTPMELEYLVEFLVEDFARHIHWRRRQMFINICQELINKPDSPSIEVIESNFLPHILELAKDKIPNIRLAVVRLLSSLLYAYIPSKSKHQYDVYTYEEHPVMQTMKMLQNDVDIDVSYVANNR